MTQEDVIGYFESEEALPAAIDRARQARFSAMTVYMPVDDPVTVEEELPDPSLVRWIALGGGLTGLALGLWMPIWMSFDYPLVTGGKPILSLPPFLVVAFELMILFAALGAVAGFLWLARLPDLTPSGAYSLDLAVDRFALVLRPWPDATSHMEAEQVLRAAGAVEVRRMPAMDRGWLEQVP